MTDTAETVDLLVIGGGINGVGIARDAALRGLSTLLLEARDFGSGTSSWSSRLIHGGLRYLEYGEISLVRESLHERRTLLKIAPHLVRPLRLVIPLYRDGTRSPFVVRLGMLAYDLLSLGKALPRHRMLGTDEVIAGAPGIRRDGLVGAASYFDAQVTFAERLVVENVVAAAEAGATLRNYAVVTKLELGTDGPHRVTWDDAREGGERSVRARVVVNAAGPWVDRVLGLSNAGAPRLMGGTKGSHLVVDPFPGAPQDACYVEAADGRPVFIIPWNGQYLIGTTDIRYDGDPAEATPSAAEVEYLLATLHAVFPSAGLTPAEINFAYAGVRPLPYVEAGPESAITRRHIIRRHAGRGLYSIIGGKLTTYRNLAEQVTDRVQKALGLPVTATRTADAPLPGGHEATVPEALRPLPPAVQQRLLALYGSRCQRLAELCRERPDYAEPVAAGSGVIAAEVALALRDEYALTLVDLLHRRLMTGLDADLGAAAADAIAAVAAREAGWDGQRLAAERDALAAWTARLSLAGMRGARQS